MSNIISLINAAKYYKNLEGQNRAWDYLTSLLTNEELTKFAELYRSTPLVEPKPSLPKDRLKLLSQWDNIGDLNKDGRPDAWQTCGVTSFAMAINAYNNSSVKPIEIDRLIVSKSGSRYSHANLAWVAGKYNIDSQFSTSTPLTSIVNHLIKGNLIVWANKLTHSGHLVLLADYDTTKKAFHIYDAWGEPNISSSGCQYNTASKKGAIYWLSLTSFNRFSMNGANSAGHWAHLLSK